MSPTVQYDPEANAAYIRLSPQPAEESEESPTASSSISTRRGAGLEVLDPRTYLPPDLLTKAA